MGYGYPFFEWDPVIEVNLTMEKDEEENIMVGENIPILCADKLVNMEIKEGDTANDDVNEEELIETDK